MSWLRRLMNTLRRGRVDRDLRREVDFHIVERIDQLRAEGMSLDQARVAAQKQFGNALRIRENTHEMNNIGWIERLTNDLRVTFRMIRKSPGFSLAAILTLALGIGSTTAVFSVVNGVLIRPLPYPEPDSLVGIWHSAQFQGITSSNVRLSSTMYLSYREHAETFADFGSWRSTRASVTGLGEPEQVPALVVTYGTLQAVGIPPAIGRWFTPADDSAGTPETVILSYGYWQRRFAGSASVVGARVTIDAKRSESSLTTSIDVRMPRAATRARTRAARVPNSESGASRPSSKRRYPRWNTRAETSSTGKCSGARSALAPR